MEKRFIVGPLARLAEQMDVELLYLFGSQASGQTGPMSDVDLGVLFPREADVPSLSSDFGRRASAALGIERVDVVALNAAPIELAYHIIRQGVLVCARSEADRVEYEARVLSLYGDYLPVLRQQRKDIIDDVGAEKRIQRYREALRRAEGTLGAPGSHRR